MSRGRGDVDLICCWTRTWCRQTSRTNSMRNLPSCSRLSGWYMVVLASYDATSCILPSSSPAVVPSMLRLALKAEQWRGGPLQSTYHSRSSSPTSGWLGTDANVPRPRAALHLTSCETRIIDTQVDHCGLYIEGLVGTSGPQAPINPIHQQCHQDFKKNRTQKQWRSHFFTCPTYALFYMTGRLRDSAESIVCNHLPIRLHFASLRFVCRAVDPEIQSVKEKRKRVSRLS